MKDINEILGKPVNGFTVNSNKNMWDYEYNPPNSNTVTVKQQEENISIANKLAKELDDEDSLNYHVFLSSTIAHSILLEALTITLAAQQQGTIRTKKIHYFRGVLTRMNYSNKSQNREERKEKHETKY